MGMRPGVVASSRNQIFEISYGKIKRCPNHVILASEKHRGVVPLAIRTTEFLILGQFKTYLNHRKFLSRKE